MKLINRKKRGTNRTRHARKCKRNNNRSTRSQRGGVTKAEVFDKVIGEFSSCTKDEFRLTINFRFGSCENFNKLLEFHNEMMSPNLKTVVCNKFTDEQIRINEYLFAIQPRVKALKIQNLDVKWPEFVVHLKKVVEAQFEKHEAQIKKQNDADMARRMLDLKFPTSDAAKAAKAKAEAAAAPRPSSVAARPSSVAARPSSVAARPSSVAPRPSSTAAAAAAAVAPDTRPEAPPGYYLVGNVWQNEKGGYYPAELFKPRAPLTGAALLAALNALKDD